MSNESRVFILISICSYSGIINNDGVYSSLNLAKKQIESEFSSSGFYCGGWRDVIAESTKTVNGKRYVVEEHVIDCQG